MKGERSEAGAPPEGAEGKKNEVNLFDPHDPKYKRVEDLPEAVRDRYVDLPDGGFVRKSSFELAKDVEKNLKRDNRLAWVVHSIAPKKWTVAEDAAYRELAERESPIDALEKNAKELAEQRLRIKLWDEMKEKLEAIGKKGFVFYTFYSPYDGSYGCHQLEGEIDGNNFSFELYWSGGKPLSWGEGKINENPLFVDQRVALFYKYRDIAFNRDEFQRLADLVAREAIKDVQERYGLDKSMRVSEIDRRYNEERKKEEEQRNKEQEQKLEEIRRSSEKDVSKLLS